LSSLQRSSGAARIVFKLRGRRTVLDDLYQSGCCKVRLPRAAANDRLDIAAGTAVRFEPGQTRDVTLVLLGCSREVYGFNGKIMGAV